MRRVAHVLREFGVISEVFIVDALLELEEVGWEPWVVAGSIKNRNLFPFPPDERLLLADRPSRLSEGLARLRFGVASGAPAATAPLEQLARVAPDVVHAQFGWAAVEACRAGRRLGLPVVASFRGFDLTVLPSRRRWERDYREVFSSISIALTSTRFLEGKLRALGFEGRVELVPSGTRLDDFPFREPIAPDGPELRLLFVGRQIPYKGLDVLLHALPAVTKEDPRVVLDVIGDGVSRAGNEALAARLGVDQRVRFHGARPRRDVSEALRRAHLFVMPSRTMPTGQAEGLGNVTKEALAVGVPVVATSSGGIPETIPPDQRDDLAEENDPDSLADRIIALLRRPDVWAERALSGRTWVERTFDSRLIATRTAEIYAQAIGHRP